MKNFQTIDIFFDNLKEMRGINELNKHLLYFLKKLQPALSENALKFLCICFSLWDDGYSCVPLQKEILIEKWNEKWEGLNKLKTSNNALFENDSKNFDFEQIIDCGIQELLNNTISGKIIARKNLDDKILDDEILPPLILANAENKNHYLYMTKHFKAKGIIEDSMERIFKGRESQAISKDEIDKCIAETSKITKPLKGKPFELNNEQALAIVRGQKENLLITGGPGTGKTTVVLYILWNLLNSNSELLNYSFYLAAPSGKAADRMQESLQKNLNQIRDEFKDSKNEKEFKIYNKLRKLEGSTIHRLLKYSKNSNNFSFNAENQFPKNSIFVIDEASMIDINLFASLLQAIPNEARFFILGDPYQLPSVDAGAVLGEILKQKSEKDFTVKLVHSNRFTDDSEIGKLAKKIKDSAENKVPFKSQEFSLHPALLNSPNEFSKKEVEYYSLQEKTHSNSTNISRKELEKNLEKFLISWLGDFKKLKELASKIEPHKLDMKLCHEIWNLSLTQRILCAERQGIFGVEQINQMICSLLEGSYKNSNYFLGQLLMINKNQEMYKLYNGDMGIVIYERNIPYILLKKANLKSEQSMQTEFVAYPLSLLPTDSIENAFAITIHKSQGSEYDHVTLFLPRQSGHPLLNNQIVYTGVTRAKKSVSIIASEDIFKEACERVISRETGIQI